MILGATQGIGPQWKMRVLITILLELANLGFVVKLPKCKNQDILPNEHENMSLTFIDIPTSSALHELSHAKCIKIAVSSCQILKLT